MAAADAGSPGAHGYAGVRTVLDGHETRLALPGITLRDSENNPRMLDELIGDRIAILNFMFTSCSTICPMSAAILRETQQRLSPRLGEEVILVSISVDPLNDTPEKLRAYAVGMGAGPHWHWLTGTPGEIGQVLRAFGIPAGGSPESHPPVILVGIGGQSSRWWRWVGMVSPDALVDAVDTIADQVPTEPAHARNR